MIFQFLNLPHLRLRPAFQQQSAHLNSKCIRLPPSFPPTLLNHCLVPPSPHSPPFSSLLILSPPRRGVVSPLLSAPPPLVQTFVTVVHHLQSSPHSLGYLQRFWQEVPVSMAARLRLKEELRATRYRIEMRREVEEEWIKMI